MRNRSALCSLLISAALVWSMPVHAQAIPNAGFEQWTAGEPDGWATSNAPPTFANVTQSADERSGSSAVLGTALDAGLGFPFPPMLFTDPQFPASSRPEALRGWYKAGLAPADRIQVVVAFEKDGSGVGGGTTVIASSASVYSEFVVNITYISPETPDSGFISFGMFSFQEIPALGSFYQFDDLSWGAPTSVEEAGTGTPASFVLHQNYPNPFNPSTTIVFELPERAQTALKVFDALGREVAELVDEELAPGRYRVSLDAGRLASGTYYYRLQAGMFAETRTLTVLK